MGSYSMDKQKIDRRLKEIEEEVLILSNYLGDSVENKLGDHLNGIKDILHQLQQSISSVSKDDDTAKEIRENLNNLRSDLKNLLTTMGSADYKSKDDNLTRRIGKTSEEIIKKIISFDVSLKETSKETIKNQYEIKKEILENLNKVQSTTETINQELLSLNTNVQESVQQTIDQQINIKDTLLREIDSINDLTSLVGYELLAGKPLKASMSWNRKKWVAVMTATITSILILNAFR